MELKQGANVQGGKPGILGTQPKANPAQPSHSPALPSYVLNAWVLLLTDSENRDTETYQEGPLLLDLGIHKPLLKHFKIVLRLLTLMTHFAFFGFKCSF